ncbi:response regulator transcription factor [Actinoplanes flavus]|uniref:Response regulator transcription factor n=1 Tax=Actinoplanes flavus TaxID=2820290 RepID=A0ABS3UQT4_9ACTN|nr:response regulator transcription factor [Actinoplanes flavus]MBO3740103.1 response regulator transcription factor [Actinoplanes flavus]
MQNGIRVAVVDDHAAFVRGLEQLLPEVSGGRATVVATAGDGAQAAGVVRDAAPDLVLVDLHMPAPGGVQAITAVRAAAPRARVLAMSRGDDPEQALEALRAGAAGFLPKTGEAAELTQPLMAALAGWALLPAPLLSVLVERSRPAGTLPAAVQLDDDDRRLLRMIATGSSTIEIAGLLHVSERTVKRLTAALLRKLRVSSRTEAAALAGSAGLV